MSEPSKRSRRHTRRKRTRSEVSSAVSGHSIAEIEAYTHKHLGRRDAADTGKSANEKEKSSGFNRGHIMVGVLAAAAGTIASVVVRNLTMSEDDKKFAKKRKREQAKEDGECPMCPPGAPEPPVEPVEPAEPVPPASTLAEPPWLPYVPVPSISKGFATDETNASAVNVTRPMKMPPPVPVFEDPPLQVLADIMSDNKVPEMPALD